MASPLIVSHTPICVSLSSNIGRMRPSAVGPAFSRRFLYGAHQNEALNYRLYAGPNLPIASHRRDQLSQQMGSVPEGRYVFLGREGEEGNKRGEGWHREMSTQEPAALYAVKCKGSPQLRPTISLTVLS